MAKKKSRKQKEGPAASFEESLAALETIVSQLEDGQLPLAEALAQYEEGVGHLKACYQLLERAERKIELLSGVDADGKAVCEPLADDLDDDLEAKAASRSNRRSRPSPKRGRRSDVDDRGRLF